MQVITMETIENAVEKLKEQLERYKKHVDDLVLINETIMEENKNLTMSVINLNTVIGDASKVIFKYQDQIPDELVEIGRLFNEYHVTAIIKTSKTKDQNESASKTV